MSARSRTGRRLALVGIALLTAAVRLSAQPAPPRVGVAFGGGSARGIAHAGVVRWFEEHHVPIDVAAGTSMGGLVGGAFAAGMSAAELRALIERTDWDAMFGSSAFPFKNLRRKQDARDFPSRLEFGLKRGLVLPASLNSGQQVDFLLARIAAPYHNLDSFDELPTPFRTVAVDLKSAERVVIDRGSLAQAMRATMSLPGVFPPVEIQGRLLVDGGAFDNIPADVVRDMGAAFVVAVDVGYAPGQDVDASMLGIMRQTIDSMMRANTRRALGAADLTITVDVSGFGSLDWRRGAELIERGYQAAEQQRATLLPLALDDASWQAWVAAREQRRRRSQPTPQYLSMDGIAPADADVIRRALQRHVNEPFSIDELEQDLTALSALDRYQAVVWELTGTDGREGLMIRAHAKSHGPPFLMLGLNLENTTSDSFRARMTGRYLAFGRLGSGSELRIDGAIGSDPAAGLSLHRPLFGSRLFVRPYGAALLTTSDVVKDGVVVAEYREARVHGGGDIGVELSSVSELTGGLSAGRVDATVRAGDPALPELGGAETVMRVRFLHDGQDSPVVPSHGSRAAIAFTHFLQSPKASELVRTNAGVSQLEGGLSTFWSWKRRSRLFVVSAAGTSFDRRPISQFLLGYPFRLDAFSIGERRGDHYGVLTGGIAHQLGRLPDFLGGPIFAATWLETGSAFNTHEDADVNVHLALGVIADTLVGPLTAGTSFGFDGGFRIFIGVGRLVR
jgi:NTE family protein